MGLDELTSEFKAELLRKIRYTVVPQVRRVAVEGARDGRTETKVLYMAYRDSAEQTHDYDALSYEELMAHPDYVDNAFYRMCEDIHRNTGLEIE